MRRLIIATFMFAAVVSLSTAGVSIRILPAPRHAEVDGALGATIKRIPAGGEFLLSVNKGQDVSYYRIQWLKDGVALPNETNPDLRYSYAEAYMNGVYTVKMSNPCATVESNPIRVTVERRAFQVNTQVATDQGLPVSTAQQQLRLNSRMFLQIRFKIGQRYRSPHAKQQWLRCVLLTL